MIDRLRILGRGPVGRAAAGLCLLAALFCAGQLVLLAYSGGEFLPLIVVYRPRLLLAAAGAAALAAWVLLSGVHLDAARLREACARGALLAASVVFAFLLAEAGLRTMLWWVTSTSRLENLDAARDIVPQGGIVSGHPLAAIIQRSPNERLVYELIPALDRDFGHKRVRTNSAGMRSDAEFAEGKPPGIVRVVGIGDSGMFGWNVEQNEDYMAVLGQLLNARNDGRRYEVLNLGVPGYNTQMEVDALILKGLRHRPDIVVVGWSDNDYQLPFMLPQKGRWTRRDVSLLWLLTFQRRRFSDLALVQVYHGSEADKERVPEFFRENSGPEGVRRSFVRLRDLSEREGFHALVFGPLGRKSAQLVGGVGLPMFNTIEKIPKGTWPKEWQVHFMHPRPEGHRLLAERLLGELVRLGWIPPAARR